MSSLFSTPKVTTPAPTVAAPTPMPDTSDPQVEAARRRTLADAAVRGGGQSTIMGGSMGGEALGAAASAPAGDSYANTTLGGGR